MPDYTDEEIQEARRVVQNHDGPSLHLTYAELACRDTARTPYPPMWYAFRLVLLAAEFEAIRELCCADLGRDVPLTVNSAYRTPEYNRRIGGAEWSQHCEGRALDIEKPKGMSLNRFFDLCMLRATTTGSLIRGIALYTVGQFVHIDTRVNGKLVTWHNNTRDRTPG